MLKTCLCYCDWDRATLTVRDILWLENKMHPFKLQSFVCEYVRNEQQHHDNINGWLNKSKTPFYIKPRLYTVGIQYHRTIQIIQML